MFGNLKIGRLIRKAIEDKTMPGVRKKERGGVAQNNREGFGTGTDARNIKDQKAFSTTQQVDYNLPVKNAAQDRIVQTQNNQPQIDAERNSVGMDNRTYDILNRNKPDTL